VTGGPPVGMAKGVTKAVAVSRAAVGVATEIGPGKMKTGGIACRPRMTAVTIKTATFATINFPPILMAIGSCHE
jgi:hypothetical protein